jgi:hypothetical protein
VSDLYTALLAFQRDAPAIQTDSVNPHFRSRYVSLHALLEAVLPVLNRHGLVLVQMPTGDGLRTTIIHADSGEYIEATMQLSVEKPTPQAQASAITYARRYSLMAALGLVADEDDDGNQATAAPATRTATNGNDGAPLVSRRQLTGLHALIGELAKQGIVDKDDVKETILAKYGVSSTKELSTVQVTEIYNGLSAMHPDPLPF